MVAMAMTLEVVVEEEEDVMEEINLLEEMVLVVVLADIAEDPEREEMNQQKNK